VSEPAPLPVRALDSCVACGSAALRPLPLVYEFRGSFPLVECDDCGLRFLRVQPAAEGLAALYSAEYFESDFRCGRSEVAYSFEEPFRAENTSLLDAFERLRPDPDADADPDPDPRTGSARAPQARRPRRLLELGSAGGWLLKHARERGWEAQGVEFSADAVERSLALGVEVFQGDLLAAALPAESFDLVYMGDVLEHVPDCHAVLIEAARVLKTGGHLYLRGPITTNSLARRLALAFYGALGRPIVLREPPYHLWEFTPGPLEHLFVSAGLDVITSRQSKIPPGRAHGEKSVLQQLAMGALDALNLPLTRLLNVAGDRIVMVGRKSA
jgi:SAM-dependent methyltransferase